MNGQELKDFTENVLDGDTIGDDFFLELLNNANALLEAMRPWEYLKAEDSSQSIASGDTFESMKTLPTKWVETLKMYVGASLLPYTQISYENRRRLSNVPRRFYIDVASSQFALTGGGNSGDVIYHVYKMTGDDLTLANSPSFPERFHKLLGFGVAGLFRSGVDYDDFNAVIAGTNRDDARAVMLAMETWDDRIKEANAEGEIAHVDVSTYPDVVDTEDFDL